MRRVEGTRFWIAGAVALFLIFPFIVVLSEGLGRFSFERQWAEVFWVTTWQAALSATLAVLGGAGGALGIGAVESRYGRARWLEFAALAPNAVPVLLFLLAFMKYLPWARGLTGVVLAHALLNVGLVAVALNGLARAKLGRLAELSWVEGSGRARFLWRVALPALGPDISRLFLFVFALCFASFSVPLVLGGVHATTVEVLIYQKIRVDADWSDAAGLALLQSLCVLAFTCALARGRAEPVASRDTDSRPLFGWWPGVALVVAPTLLMLAGLLDFRLEIVRQLLAMERLRGEFPALVMGSMITATIAGLLMMAVLFAIAYVRPSGVFRSVLVGYVAPSAALTGFALLVVWRSLGVATYFKIAIGVALVSLPSFLRWQWDGLLAGLQGQIEIARTLGAGPGLIFRRVLAPQLVKVAAFCAGVTALWSWGDFALSSVVAERTMTVAMAARGLMEAYLLDGATVMAWIMLAGGLLSCAIFVGVGNVLGSRSQT